jgi:hypothetical protein
VTSVNVVPNGDELISAVVTQIKRGFIIVTAHVFPGNKHQTKNANQITQAKYYREPVRSISSTVLHWTESHRTSLSRISKYLVHLCRDMSPIREVEVNERSEFHSAWKVNLLVRCETLEMFVSRNRLHSLNNE